MTAKSERRIRNVNLAATLGLTLAFLWYHQASSGISLYEYFLIAMACSTAYNALTAHDRMKRLQRPPDHP